MKATERNYELAAKIAKFHDDMLLGTEELAAFLGLSQVTIQTNCVRLPKRVEGLGRMVKWRFGDVRAFICEKSRPNTETPIQPTVAKIPKIGRPTKAEQIERDRMQQKSLRKAK